MTSLNGPYTKYNLFNSFLFSLTLATATAHSAPPPAPQPVDPSSIAALEQLGKTYESVAAQIMPAVVSVFSEKIVKYKFPHFPFQDNETPQNIPIRGVGSGMILDKEGHILTNYHVVGGVDRIKVRLADKTTFPAEVTGTDPKTDIAIIQIKGTWNQELPVATLGDSDSLHVGALVLAVGAPFNLPQTVTHGIISATGRSNVGISDYEDFLQTDAPINPGNSGGPLVNLKGEVIGINTAIAGMGQSSGVGFSIPINMAKTILPTLLKGEKVTRGQLGVIIQEITEELAKEFQLSSSMGVLVADVQTNSPAQRAGIKVGDVILTFDGKAIMNPRELRNLVSPMLPGQKANVEVLRNGKRQNLTVEMGLQDRVASFYLLGGIYGRQT